ncbi:MAG: response regulator [Steroidobacteraceae bacterium]|nr:response regulator [Steroidobacteraceae bacterium]
MPYVPIRKRLMSITLMTSAAVLLLSVATFLVYDFVSFRHLITRHVATLGRLVAANSSAALVSGRPEEAHAVLGALRADPNVVAAAVYDADGNVFGVYPPDLSPAARLPLQGAMGYRVDQGHLIGREPIMAGARRMGTLVIESDLGALLERVRVHALLAGIILAVTGAVAYFVSRGLQQQVSRPLLALTAAARAVSDRRDYSVRAPPSSGLELVQLTDAFNHMLTEIQKQHSSLQAHLSRMLLLQHITRAIAERQDLQSIFQVVLQNLEQDLPIDFGCLCLYDDAGDHLRVVKVGGRSLSWASRLDITEQSLIPIDANGLKRCLGGVLVHEPDTTQVAYPFPQRLARCGLHSVVIAPLSVENRVFGLLVAARQAASAFVSADCEFLKHLCEHVALATQQAQLYAALQQAYEDLRQTQHTVMQHERLRALGQMASGVAHDINNAISPVALYTESLLEREKDLSPRARSYLLTIQRAIEDVASTVARMREFYRPREPQLLLARVSVNTLVEQVMELTRPRWSALPQQRGTSIHLQLELDPSAPAIVGAEPEIRDALINLIFNAVDAMPDGGTLTLRTRQVEAPASVSGEMPVAQVHVEVSDTGVGMNEETRRRCLEPFFTTKGERGTGLGLAMVYGMVQRHSAELEIDSAPGRGTTMRLVFAAYVDDASNTVRVQALPAVERRLRILLVDDDPLLIKSLQDTLEAEGHVITAAHGGEQGIEAFRKAHEARNPFNVVVTDLGMPNVDGRKVAAAIKAISASTPIVLLTGWGQRLAAENDVPPHVNRVINKPPKLLELRAVLAELTADA